MDNECFKIAIDKKLISEFPTVTFSGAITVIEHPEDVAEAISYLRGHDIVGFDTETKPNFKKGMTNRVSLIQVSTEDRSFLFRPTCGPGGGMALPGPWGLYSPHPKQQVAVSGEGPVFL